MKPLTHNVHICKDRKLYLPRHRLKIPWQTSSQSCYFGFSYFCESVNWKVYYYIQGNFCPVFFFALQHLQTVSLHLELAMTHLEMNISFLITVIYRSFEFWSQTDKKVEESKNKTGSFSPVNSIQNKQYSEIF